MIKEVSINSHIFSRNLEAKLPNGKFMVFNLVSKDNGPLLEIVDTNSDDLKSFCKEHGTKFAVDKSKSIDINGKFQLIFK